MKKINYLDLFSGVGGFALGLERAGIKVNKHYYAEIDKYADAVYRHHFPTAIGLGDVKNINATELGRIDLITFGFPCQDLSVAGKGKGLDGERSGLFYDALRIVAITKPTHFIFENVKGLFAGDNFERCLRAIADLGIYECEWQLCNTNWFLPQNRERIYFIGHLAGQSRPKVFPIGGESKIDIRKSTALNPGASQGARVFNIDGDAPTQVSHRADSKTGLYIVPRGTNPGGMRDVENCPSITKSNWEHNNFIAPVLTPARKEKRQNGRQIKNNGEDAFTLTTQDQHGITVPINKLPCLDPKRCADDGLAGCDNCARNIGIRRLTPIECERLQGFPDDWTLIDFNGRPMPNRRRHGMMGNAVSVPLPKIIFEKLYKEEKT